MISCGEPSGDLYAAALAREIRALEPDAAITGFGGERLRAAGAALISDFSGLSVTGLLEAARVLPRSYAIYKRLVADATRTRPDVFVAIDFPDFNLRLARAMRSLDVPVVYYVSPQIWAWRKGRMKSMKRLAERVLVIFPFEEDIYKAAGVPVTFVGHPLLELTGTPQPRERFLARYGLEPADPIVALLPGSRRNEVREILPGLARAARLIQQAIPRVQFVVARAPHLADELFAPLHAQAAGSPLTVAIVDGHADEVLAAASVALVASGTVTVQAALHECPMVVVYRLSALTYRLGRPFVHVDTFAMANLVAGRKVVPELIQDDFTPESVAREALKVLNDPAAAARVRLDLRAVRAKLGDPGASNRAAQAIVEVARRAGART